MKCCVIMYKTTVILSNFAQLKAFVQVCSEQTFSIDLADGERVVHAKSIIGVLSMPFGQPLQLSVAAGDAAAIRVFAERLQPFLAE